MTIKVKTSGKLYEAYVQGERLGHGISPDEAVGHAMREMMLRGDLQGISLEYPPENQADRQTA
jgi:hypothetical protein